ncbi:isoprenoid biosynthesis protein ElbB [bacterium]|nr:MAG: isoprenoid biosynthesis protein ElbB [bacterium]
MSKIGLLLSGCGVQDGSEISEAVLTLLALERAGADVLPVAPDVMQAQVWNHYTGQEVREESRGVLAESARITRGKITAVNTVGAADLDALILVGGYGAAKNLCTYANDGTSATVNPDVERLISQMVGLGKPIGAMCIAPIVVALSLKNSDAPRQQQVTMTIGNETNTAQHLETLNVRHMEARPDQICIDDANNIVTTPAFMLGETAAECEPGITKLVNEIVQRANQLNRLV